MSRIGKSPIALPAGVTFTITGNDLTVKGPKGELKLTTQEFVRIEQVEQKLIVTVEKPEQSFQRACWGLSRALVANMVQGVAEGFKKSLEIIGVGYKFEIASPTKLILSVGFSHKVEMVTPKGITVTADTEVKNTVHITGIDKQLV
jgi:large subunit ribosomal protein L6